MQISKNIVKTLILSFLIYTDPKSNNISQVFKCSKFLGFLKASQESEKGDICNFKPFLFLANH